MTNPTAEHLKDAEESRRRAADHRAASQALRDAEAQACRGIPAARAVPGMTAQWLQRVVDCHVARNAALGHDAREMPSCPLVPKGVRATVTATKTGFADEVRAEDADSAKEILSRANALTK